MQLGERRSVRGGQLVRQRRFEHAQRLTELHRAALEVAEDLEHLLCRPSLDVGDDPFGGNTGQSAADAGGGAAGKSERECGQAGGSGDRFAGKRCGVVGIGHVPIMAGRRGKP